jgi:hypothetical protein
MINDDQIMLPKKKNPSSNPNSPTLFAGESVQPERRSYGNS